MISRPCILILALIFLARANGAEPGTSLTPDRTKSGPAMLQAFASVANLAKDSVVRLDIDNKEAALGTVIDAVGLVLTKASEVDHGKLTCKLSSGERVEARLLASDEENDLALVKVKTSGLKPVSWAPKDPLVGQWVITVGVQPVPEAVGVVSVPPRKIFPKRALIGVQLDFEAPEARINVILAGLGADKAGLRPGDIILAINDVTVKDSQECVNILRNFREGQTVSLSVQRDTDQLDVDVQLAIPKPDRRYARFNRQDRMNRLGTELSRRAEGFQLALQHDTVLQPWQCGGPLVNLDGQVVGLNIARAGRVASYALPERLVKQLADTLRKQSQLPVRQEQTAE